MKKIITTLAFVLFTTSAFSYSCPMLRLESDRVEAIINKQKQEN